MNNIFLKIAKNNLSLNDYRRWLSHVKNADNLNKNNKIKKSIECYKKALMVYPDDFFSTYMLGRFEIRKRNFKKGLSYFNKCLKIRKNDVSSLYWKAFSYYEMKDLKSAFPIYKKILLLTKKHANTWHDLGHCYLAFRKYKEAEQCFKKEISLEKPDSHTLTIYGDSLFFQRKYEQAVKCYQIALKKEPENFSALASLGGSLYAWGRLSNAVEYLEKAIEIRPNDDYVLHHLGHCYSRLHRHSKAIESFRKEIDTGNYSKDCWYEIGNSYFELKQYQNALNALKKSLKIEKNDVSSWVKMGETYVALKQYAKSAKCFEKVETLKGKRLVKKEPLKKYDNKVVLPKDDKSDHEGKEKKVFIVHGHDVQTLRTLTKFVEYDLKLNPLILSELPPRGRYLMEKIEDYLSESGFVIVLLTPDDVGFPRRKLDEEGYRARQNVILEYGLSRGKLGRENVCLLYKGDVEIPTDILGVNYIEMDRKGKWKRMLVQDLIESNMQVAAIA